MKAKTSTDRKSYLESEKQFLLLFGKIFKGKTYQPTMKIVGGTAQKRPPN